MHNDFGPILLRPFGFLVPRLIKYLALQYFDFKSFPDEGDSRNGSCTLN
jgi:hypothetical protein